MTHFVPAGQRTPPPEALSFVDKVVVVVGGVAIPRPENHATPQAVGLAYDVHHIALAADEQLEAWYISTPQPRGIVLMFPGYAASKDMLLAPAAILHNLGYDALLVDFRGVGGSSGNDTSIGVREGVDVARAVAYAQQQWPHRPIILYGISMGSAAILRSIAHEGVQPSAIILESPFDRLLSTVQNRFHTMGVPAFPAAEAVVLWGGVQHGMNGFAHNPATYAASVTCPTLLLHGENDPRVTAAQANAIFDNLGGPKQVVPVAGAGHELLIAADPQAWKQEVADFLARSPQQ